MTVTSSAAAGRQGSRPAGSAPIQSSLRYARQAWVPSLRKKPWKTVFFLRSAPALIGGSETLAPHIRSRSDGRESEAVAQLRSRTIDRREITPTNNVTPSSARSVGQEGLVANNKATALNVEKRPFSRAFFAVKGPGTGAERWRQAPPVRRDHCLQVGKIDRATNRVWPQFPEFCEEPFFGASVTRTFILLHAITT